MKIIQEVSRLISIIIAAGKQSRFKSDVPKALAKLDNGEVLAVHNYNMLKRTMRCRLQWQYLFR